MRKPLIAGNWKMNKTVKEATALAKELAGLDFPSDREVVIAPPFVCLAAVEKAIKSSAIQLGAQNLYPEAKGAFTGEVSADMLKSAGVSHVILGHSERRTIFGETNTFINRKVVSALGAGLTAILCVGELLEEREKGVQNDVVKEQTIACLSGVSNEALEHLVIAYEPVWAIGTGKTASPEDADEMHAFIRAIIGDLYSKSSAESLRILYGGSVNESTVDTLLAKTHIDGALVGGASLKAESFSRIMNFKEV